MKKQRLIYILSEKLEKAGCIIHHSKGDSLIDTLIAQTAVESARHTNTVLVGEDTDLLVLLLYMYHPNEHPNPLYFCPEPKADSKGRTWDTRKAQEMLTDSVSERLFRVGKSLAFKKLLSDSQFQNCARLFLIQSDQITCDEIIEAGEKALVCLYNGSENESLDTLRCRRFKEKVVKCSKAIQAEVLPPSSAAAKYHSLRDFYQISEWKGEEGSLTATDWGWMEKDSKFISVQTDLPTAPDYFLEVFHCGCKTGCTTLRCTGLMYLHGLDCTFACGHCKGSSCSISEEPQIVDPDVDIQTQC